MTGKRSIPIILLLIIAFCNLCPASQAEHKKYLKYIRTSTDVSLKILEVFQNISNGFFQEQTQSSAALDLIYRTIPDYADYFRVHINFSLPNNYYEVNIVLFLKI